MKPQYNILPKKYLKANYYVIEQDLYNYKTMVDYINRMIVQESESDYEPSIKARVPDNIYVKTPVKFKSRQEGDSPEYISGHQIRETSNPTHNMAMVAIAMEKKNVSYIINAIGFNEMYRRVKAIEETLDRFDFSHIPDEKRKSALVKERYFEHQLTPDGLATKYDISRRTVYNWCDDVIQEIALKLGFLI